MVWTASLTNYSDGNTPTHTQLNEYLANIEWMRSPPKSSYVQTVDTNITTASTTWVSLGASFELTISVGAGAHVLTVLSLYGNRLAIDIEFDGTRIGSTPATTGSGIAENPSTTVNQQITVVCPFFNLSAGSHTWKAVMKATSGTGTIAGSLRPRFYLKEL